MSRKSGVKIITAAAALWVLLLDSCCKHEVTEMSAISMGVADKSTKAVIGSTADLISQYFQTGGEGFGVYGYKNVSTNSTQYRLFNNVEVYPTNDDADDPDWTYQHTRYWDSNPNANYHFIAYWPHLTDTESATGPYVSEEGETLTIHNIPNWQPISTGYDYMLAEPRVGKHVDTQATPLFGDGYVRFTFSHLLAKVEFRAYCVGAESEITVNQITLKSPDNNTPTVLLDGGSTNVSRVFNASNTTTQLGTPGSGQSKNIMPASVALPDSVFFNEHPDSVPKYQTLCSWLTFPCSYWNNLNLSVNYSISGSALTGTSQGLTLSTPVNEVPNTGITLPGHSYVVTLKFTISSGIEIESIQVKKWTDGGETEHWVYNW